ncbi:hypothetical protein EDD75_2244 [Thermodesulfitimonas autotrophica]|uniref:Uncharacterized protein n=1 Tax=Thermodesulfitimonas autotrophica TaxID=1894989 RepID=A0A3N5ABZ0_9THEO|nr:hypothetical protein [Thermodesulfitimonas autotrophica]RPF42023.1 hypothetical protein EDD75_2244 [Thermodesulfitimonas autotrophica]
MREYDNGVWRYVPAGKDVWGRPVYAAYFLGRFAGYRYRRTAKDFARLRKLYGHDVPASRWEECPEWCVVLY